MTTFERKVCMLGAAGVGKTSLVRRFVEGIFAERYLSTIGVKVDRRVVSLGEDQVNLVLWDIEGETQYRTLRFRYLRGAAGYLLVADGTQPRTLDTARQLQEKVADMTPGLPFVLLLNKHDLAPTWLIGADEIGALEHAGWSVCMTSAKTGVGVESAFERLAIALHPSPG